MSRKTQERLSVLSILLIAGLLPLAANEPAGSEGPKFLFETGSPPWRGERIPLPPSFARDLGWTGVEEIRFAPGMFQPTKPDFFSYILVFALEPGSDLSEKGLKQELLTYYRGLSKSAMESAEMEVDTESFTISLEKTDLANAGAPDAAPKARAWTATLDWVEPFATRKKQTLHFELHTWVQGETPVVLSCVSPLDPKADAAPWESLRAIRKTFRLE